MTANLERIRVLLQKYSTKMSSETEDAELYRLLSSSTENEIEPLLSNILENTEPSYDADRSARIFASILQHTSSEADEEQEDMGRLSEPNDKPIIQLWKRIAVAASIAGVLFVAGYWLLNRQTADGGEQTAVVQVNDVAAPDKSRAQIKLADGTIVYLDSVENGQLANMNGVVVKKTDDGRIEYYGQLAKGNGQIVYNTLSNPRGSKVINMVLSDGSRVWLNAESSVTYPIVFVGNERKVHVKGEVYFEVNSQRATATGQKVPFIVEANGTVTEVLGTHFNVNAYEDESDVKVTLLEGKVKTSIGTSRGPEGEWAMLRPGEQAKVTLRQAQSTINVVKGVDVDEVMAWKNGKFVFGGKDLQTVMLQISRWYDVEIVYEADVPVANFRGSISRQENVQQVLNMLSLTEAVKFRVEGKKIVVSK